MPHDVDGVGRYLAKPRKVEQMIENQEVLYRPVAVRERVASISA